MMSHLTNIQTKEHKHTAANALCRFHSIIVTTVHTVSGDMDALQAMTG